MVCCNPFSWESALGRCKEHGARYIQLAVEKLPLGWDNVVSRSTLSSAEPRGAQFHGLADPTAALLGQFWRGPPFERLQAASQGEGVGEGNGELWAWLAAQGPHWLEGEVASTLRCFAVGATLLGGNPALACSMQVFFIV